ncbi:GvpL/GvpF family gas vesicle protein [Thalassobacillus sp. CUG 92003]|uniref:GvpL/GvpF family gas vesicle protein n=1 Tax=Thalassobacillus sp. CUG 92003 TaxID=2736641 RepID=UPI0015E6E455|nr:GvpL/GvpF family gas vesicle protein [Thalassobacillus sp. CUG 92003]
MSDLIYLYGIVPNHPGQNECPAFKGLDQTHEVYTLSYGTLAAVVCTLDGGEYSEEALKEKSNQMEWVQEKAFHHHEALLTIREALPVVPMKFCTIYASRSSLTEMIESHKEKLVDLLARLEDKEEWNLKIYCDTAKLKEEAEAHNLTIQAKRDEIATMSPGRQYLEKRKLDQVADEEVEKEKDAFCTDFHEELKAFCEDSTVKDTWNKQVTGKDVEMCWNSAYLLATQDVEQFLATITKMKEQSSPSGWQIEATGPWPAYHFANLS